MAVTQVGTWRIGPNHMELSEGKMPRVKFKRGKSWEEGWRRFWSSGEHLSFLILESKAMERGSSFLSASSRGLVLDAFGGIVRPHHKPVYLLSFIIDRKSKNHDDDGNAL